MRSNQQKKSKQGNGVALREVLPQPLIFKKDKFYLTVVVLVFALAHLNGLKANFTFDDYNAVVKNKVTDHSTPWTAIFVHDFWGHRLTEIASNDSFRPLTVFTFKLQHFLLGYHSPLFLRLFNLFLAAVNTVLVYYMSRILSYLLFTEKDIRLLVKDKIEDDHIKRQHAFLQLIPLCTAALFAVHPVHVEAATSIVGRSELICAALGFYAFICLHLYLQRRSMKQLARTLLLLGLSVFGKESGVTFGAMFIVYLLILLYLRRVDVKGAARAIICMVGFVLMYVQFRKYFIGHVDLSESPLIRRTENPQYFIPPGLLNWWSMRWVVLMKNLELSFFPTTLNCEYSFNCIPHMDSIKDARFFPFACVTAFFAVLGFTLLYRSVASRSRVCSVFLLCLLWYGISLSPVTHIFVKVGTFIAERCLYIPSFSAVYLSVAGLFVLTGGCHAASRVPYVVVVLICVAIWWTWLTVRRNEDWYDNEALFRSNMRVCKRSGKAHYQTGLAIAKRKNVIDEEVRGLMETAAAIDDGFFEPYIYLAYYDYEHKNYMGAYEKARRCVAHPITAKQCEALYENLCKRLFPTWKKHDMLADMAGANTLVQEAAKMYRLAGLAALQEANTTAAATNFHKSVTTWKMDAHMNPWMGAWDEPLTDHIFCNALYWYAHTYPNTVLLSSPPFNETALVDLIQELGDGCERCRKRWSVGRVLTAKDSQVPSYQKCLTDYNTVAQESLSALLSISSHPNTTTRVKQKAREVSVEIGIMQLCNVAELSGEATPPIHALERLFPQQVAFIQSYFANNQLTLINGVKELISLAKEGKTLDDQRRRRWSDLMSCSTLVSAPLFQEIA